MRFAQTLFVVGAAAALLVTSCDSFEVLPDEVQFINLRILQWPDTLAVGDSALAEVQAVDQLGRSVEGYGIGWEMDSVRVAGLHGGGTTRERRVLGFSPGTARLSVYVYTVYTVSEPSYISGAPTGITVVTTIYADTTLPVVVATKN